MLLVLRGRAIGEHALKVLQLLRLWRWSAHIVLHPQVADGCFHSAEFAQLQWQRRQNLLPVLVSEVRQVQPRTRKPGQPLANGKTGLGRPGLHLSH